MCGSSKPHIETTEESMDNLSLAHSRYNCTYHIVFIPKYRRKAMFGNLRKEVGEAISKVFKIEGVTIIKAAPLPDHVHMYVSIPPKMAVSKVVGRIKGKSSLMLFEIQTLIKSKLSIGTPHSCAVSEKIS